jgi:hypothetical protein
MKDQWVICRLKDQGGQVIGIGVSLSSFMGIRIEDDAPRFLKECQKVKILCGRSDNPNLTD